MKYPALPQRILGQQTLEGFYGLNRNLRIGEGELEDMENLSSRRFPVLTCRQPRGTVARPASPQGLIAKEGLCYVDGPDFVLGGTRVALGLSVQPEDCPKTLVSMGAVVIILPDKKYINTADPGDFGTIEAENTVAGASFSLCRRDGSPYAQVVCQDSAPDSPENGCLWMDTGALVPGLMEYSVSQGQWTAVNPTCVRIDGPGIGAGLAQYDTVRLSGCPELSGSFCIWAIGEDFLVVEGLITQGFVHGGSLTVSRKMPVMDLCFEAENRLWGCRYGQDAQGNPVNELYASKLGDFRNWESFLGLASDSYRASCGADGPFTGGISFLGYPLFFREGCIHKVYGTDPSSYRIQTIPCRGVQPGCGKSLVQVGQQLVYRARGAFCSYDGSQPVEISQALGREECLTARAGSLAERYYVSMEKTDHSWELLVWDSSRGLWHREDGLQVSDFCPLAGELYAVDVRSRNILGLLGTGEPEQPVAWMAQTGELGPGSPCRGYISQLHLRLRLEPGARLACLVQYDSQGDWEELGVVFGTSVQTIRLPLRPRRCEHLKLRLAGTGEAQIYSITKTIEKGSDWR